MGTHRNCKDDTDTLRAQLLEQSEKIALLERKETLYRNIIETTNAVAWELDIATLKFTYISPQVEALSGYPPEAWTNFEFWASTIHEDLREDISQWCQAETAKGLDHDVEYPMIRADGSHLWIRDVVSVISKDGAPLLLRGHFYDISQSKAAEEETRAMEASLNRTQKLESLGVLVSGIAHDFNNLLVGIMGNLDLCLQHSGINPALLPMLQDAKKASDQAAALIQEMLAYAGKEQMILDRVDPNSLLLDMWRLLDTACSKQVDLSHNLCDDVSAVQADPSLLRQIIMNLVINASDAIGPTAGAIVVTTRMGGHSDLAGFTNVSTTTMPGSEPFVIVEVADTGCGITQDDLNRIFEPFYTTKEMGRGLGLAAVQGIIDRHNGMLWIRSEPGFGTTFRVILPQYDRDQTEEQPIAPAETTSKCKGRVLVVDDEDIVRRTAVNILTHCGFETLQASNGIEALKVYGDQGEGIDCVLLDRSMPIMGGEETLISLRELDPNVKVILSSGNLDPDMGAKLNATGAVQKPYSIKALTDALVNALQAP